MNVDQALSRIKKCLALAKSANEHEAAAALRQATALMRKFNLEHASVLASQASEASAKSRTKSRPSQWERVLVAAISKQFSCGVIIQRTYGSSIEWVFVGTNHSAQIAAYAFSVLLRQVIQARAAFLSELPKAIGVGDKKRMGNRFCLGWVTSVYRLIQQYSGKENEEQDPAVTAYIEQQKIQKATPPRSRPKAKLDKADAYAFSLGAMAGKGARLHRGVGANQEEQGLLL